MIDVIRKLAVLCALTGCFGEPGEGGPAQRSCSELRGQIVMDCEGEAEAMDECIDNAELGEDCNDQLEQVNTCVMESKDSLEDGQLAEPLSAAFGLAYWCDILNDPGMCEWAVLEAEEDGIESCALPENF